MQFITFDKRRWATAFISCSLESQAESGVSAQSPLPARDVVRPVQTCGCDGTPHSHRLIVKVFIFSGKMENSRSTTYNILHSKYELAGYILEIKNL